MTMARSRYAVEELDHSACLRLLRRAPIGRVGFTDRALPRILPVHCLVQDGEVVVARRHNAELKVSPGEIVAFETDAYDPATREGWCVGLVGTCRAVTDSDEVAELDELDFAPWRSEEGGAYIGISIGLLHGRALIAIATGGPSLVSD